MSPNAESPSKGGGDASVAAAPKGEKDTKKKTADGGGGGEGKKHGKQGGAAAKGGGGGKTAAAAYLSPIAHPLLEGKLLRRSLKLIHLAADRERANRSSSSGSKEAAAVAGGGGEEKKKQQQRAGGGAPGARGASWKLLRRGVHEVTKCLRRDVRGIVFFASDVFPIEIIAHLPIFCEEKDVLYGYLCSKRTLGHAFRSQRPASVIMLTPDPKAGASSLSAAAAAAAGPSKKKQKTSKGGAGAAAEEGEENEEDATAADEGESFEQLYKKVEKAIRKMHPYF